MFTCSASAASHAAGGADIIGIDLGTTNSCVAVMEGKVTTAAASDTLSYIMSQPLLTSVLGMDINVSSPDNRHVVHADSQGH